MPSSAALTTLQTCLRFLLRCENARLFRKIKKDQTSLRVGSRATKQSAPATAMPMPMPIQMPRSTPMPIPMSIEMAMSLSGD